VLKKPSITIKTRSIQFAKDERYAATKARKGGGIVVGYPTALLNSTGTCSQSKKNLWNRITQLLNMTSQLELRYPRGTSSGRWGRIWKASWKSDLLRKLLESAKSELNMK
jgi:hypothetical protein